MIAGSRSNHVNISSSLASNLTIFVARIKRLLQRVKRAVAFGLASNSCLKAVHLHTHRRISRQILSSVNVFHLMDR